MTEQVTKQKITHSIYTNFYDIVSTIEPSNIFAERIFPSMPDIELNEKNSYPIIILESSEIDLTIFSIGKNLTTGTINFNVFTTSAKLRDEIIDKIIYTIETNKGVLATNNLRQIEIDKITMDQIARGKIKVNFCTIPIKFKFWSDKTQAF
jgi:TATA-box binding protein (TBP) (component of TFIID and TFIIIB)